jgi:hypothetical protein
MTVSLVEMLGLDLLSKVGSKIAELETENVELREQLRWRKWPEEKPEETGRNPYTVILGCDCVQATFSSGRWLMDERMSFEDVADMVTHWRPIGELPGE